MSISLALIFSIIELIYSSKQVFLLLLLNMICIYIKELLRGILWHILK